MSSNALKPLLEDRSVLKIGQNLKYDILVLKRYGIGLTPLDDTMLMSYALDGGRGGHGMDDLAQRHLGHTCIPFKQVIAHAPGKKAADKSFRRRPDRQGRRVRRRGRRRHAAPLDDAQAAPRRRAHGHRLRDSGARSGAGDRRHGARRHPGRPQRSWRACRQPSRSAPRNSRTTVYELAGQKFNLASPRQLGELLFDHLKLPGGKKTKTGQWETRANLLDDLAGNPDLPDDARR